MWGRGMGMVMAAAVVVVVGGEAGSRREGDMRHNDGDERAR